MAPLASWLWLVAVSASPQVTPVCLSPAPASGLYAATNPTEVCHPDSGCHRLNLQVAVVGGCLGLPAIGASFQVTRHAQDAKSVSRTVRQTGPMPGAGCQSQIHARWSPDLARDDAIIVDVTSSSLCRKAAQKAVRFSLQRTASLGDAPGAAIRLLGDARPQVAGAALDHLSTFRERPPVCEALAMVISSGPPTLANRVLLVADAPCLLGATIQALDVVETRAAAEDALVAHVESPTHRRSIFVDAAVRGIPLPKMAPLLHGQLRDADRDKMMLTLRQTTSVATATTIAFALDQTSSVDDTGAFLLEVLPELSCPVVTALGTRPSVVAAFATLSNDASDALLDAADQKWQRESCPDWNRVRSFLELSRIDDDDDDVVGAAPDMSGRDPFDLDEPSDDAALDDTAPPMLLDGSLSRPGTDNTASADDTDLLEGDVAAISGTDEGAPPEGLATARSTSFTDGLSVSPYVAATAFLDGPMAGAGLQLAWNIGPRFSFVTGASASFSCPICSPDATGTRTDLRAEFGLQAVAFPEEDLGPFGRISIIGNHAEVLQQRRAVFQDALGAEVTIGLDWIATNGLRLFLEGGGFVLNEVTRSVRPEGQAAPAPSGVVPADVLSIGVQARVGVSFGL